MNRPGRPQRSRISVPPYLPRKASLLSEKRFESDGPAGKECRTDRWMRLKPPDASSDSQRLPASVDTPSFLAMAMSTEALSQANMTLCESYRAISQSFQSLLVSHKCTVLANSRCPGLAESSRAVAHCNVVGGKALLFRAGIDTLYAWGMLIRQ